MKGKTIVNWKQITFIFISGINILLSALHLRNIIRSALEKIMAYYTYEIIFGHVIIKRRGYADFMWKIMGHTSLEWEFLSSLDLKGKSIYDIGGHTGLLAIFFSKSAGAKGQVIIFEPNEENYNQIHDNLQMNGVNNARLFNIGIGDKEENRIITVRHSESATGTIDERIQAQIVKEGNFKQLEVKVDTLDNIISTNGLPKPDFIKIDIEGMEYYALLGMYNTIYRYSPSLHIEIHGNLFDEPNKIENISRIVNLLQSWGYSIWHIESKQNITTNNYQIGEEGHIFAQWGSV
ncbi:FkbM family methyltransferase [Chloroflexota bacterium]